MLKNLNTKYYRLKRNAKRIDLYRMNFSISTLMFIAFLLTNKDNLSVCDLFEKGILIFFIFSFIGLIPLVAYEVVNLKTSFGMIFLALGRMHNGDWSWVQYGRFKRPENFHDIILKNPIAIFVICTGYKNVFHGYETNNLLDEIMSDNPDLNKIKVEEKLSHKDFCFLSKELHAYYEKNSSIIKNLMSRHRLTVFCHIFLATIYFILKLLGTLKGADTF